MAAKRCIKRLFDGVIEFILESKGNPVIVDSK